MKQKVGFTFLDYQCKEQMVWGFGECRNQKSNIEKTVQAYCEYCFERSDKTIEVIGDCNSTR